MTGQIIKGIGGFYYVSAQKEIYTLKAPGRFRKEGIKPVVGDRVEFDCNDGYIQNILPRKNEFYRPAVANVTQAFIVMTGANPKVDLLLIDKLIIQCELADINIVIVINKCDLMSDEEIDELSKQYSYYNVVCCSSINNYGISEIKKLIKGNVSFFAGQSGVGKSSLINCVSKELSHETGNISKKLKRGKHTTRHVELSYIPDLEGSILDTPGFSFYDFKGDFSIEETYREFDGLREKCRFTGCTHVNEPDCAVKAHVGETINKLRYERYVQIFEMQKEMREKQYD